MTLAINSVPEVLTFDYLRTLAGVEGVCLSAAFCIPDPAQAAAYLNSHLNSMQHALENNFSGRQAGSEGNVRTFLNPVRELLDSEKTWGRGVVLYRSADLFQHFQVDHLSEDFVTVGERFELRPLLSLMARDQEVYVLALSQKHTRLLRFANRRAEEVPLPERTPRSLQDWMQTSTPDHVMENRATAGPGSGSSKGVMFGTNSDDDREPEYLSHFFKAVDKGVHEVLKNGSAPLILAGVEFELPLYRRENSYTHLVEQAIHGAPDGMGHGELEKRVLELTDTRFSAPLQKILNEFEGYRNKSHVMFSPHQVLQASKEGRVRTLLIHGNAPQDEKFNIAAIETLNHKGEAYEVPPGEMPEGAAIAAVLRY
jgi:hypothetical protein